MDSSKYAEKCSHLLALIALSSEEIQEVVRSQIEHSFNHQEEEDSLTITFSQINVIMEEIDTYIKLFACTQAKMQSEQGTANLQRSISRSTKDRFP